LQILVKIIYINMLQCWQSSNCTHSLPAHPIQNTLYKDGIHLDLGRIDVCTQRIITPYTCKIFTHFKNIPYDYCVANMVLHLYI
jgi:hypothetical protein